MNTGHVFELLALAAAVVAAFAQARHLLSGGPISRRVAFASVMSAALFIVLSYSYLTWAFLVSRLDIEYVFLYSKTTYPWYYKLSGTWGAQKGTMVLWTALVGVCLALFVASGPPRQRATKGADQEVERAHAWTALFLTLLFTCFLFLVARQDTYAATPEFLLSSRPTGNGLNPILQAPLSLVHPPAEFLAYALTAVPAAAGLAFLMTGTPAWALVCATWSRVAWGVYTLGLGVGALWAYHTLSFGGYWAWDPVETANLIPWIALTAFVHARIQTERHGRYRTLSPMLAVSGLWFSLFATLATRSGLWVSVHAFTDPTGTFARDPLLRLVNIMHVEAQVAAIVGFMGALLFATLGLAAARLAPSPLVRWGYAAACFAAAGAFAAAPVTTLSGLWEALAIISGGHTAIAAGVFFTICLALPALPSVADRAEAATRKASGPLFSHQNLAYIAILLLLAAFLATLLLDLRGVNGSDRSLFDRLAPLFAVPMAVAIVPLLGNGLLEPRLLLAVTAGTAVVSVLLAFALPGAWVVALATPVLAVGLALGFLQLVRAITRPVTVRAGDGAARAQAPRAVVALLLSGSLASFAFWSHPPSILPLLDIAVALSAPWQVAGLVLASVAFGLTANYGRAGHAPSAMAASGITIVLFGYGIGLLAGAAALVILLTVKTRDGPSQRLGEAWRRARASLRPFAVHLLHISVLVGLLGYAWSTYAAVEPDETLVVGSGGQTRVGPYVLSFEHVETVFDPLLNQTTMATAFLRVEKDGEFLGHAQVRMHWVTDVTHYDPDTRILRLSTGDVYIASLAMCRDPAMRCSSNDDWIEAHENGVTPLAEDEALSAFAFRAKVLPLVGILWASLWLSVVALAFLVISGSAQPPSPRRAREPSQMAQSRLEEALMREVRGAPPHTQAELAPPPGP